jgi:hypothetical protein
MAIGPDQKVTTTGLMGGTPKLPNAPDMSGLSKVQPQQTQGQAPAPMAERPAPVEDQNLENKVNELTDEDKITLETVLSPSVVDVLKKIAPELSPLLDQAKSNEENVTLPISVVRNYAIKIYGGDEKEAIQNFITDLSGEQPDNTNVPPDTATQPQGMMAQDPNAEQDINSEMEAIDSGQELA